MGGIYWLASYPKSGNTWVRTFLHNLRENGEHPFNINTMHDGGTASSRGWLDEVLGFDTADLHPDQVDRLRPLVHAWTARETPILYRKIHDAYRIRPGVASIVGAEGTLGALYILRNPLDVAVSAAGHWQVSIDKAIDRMGRSDMVLAGAQSRLREQVRQPLSSWSQHVLGWVDAEELNRLVLRYEDLLASPQSTFQRVAAFLGLPDDPEQVARAVRFSDFAELARQEATDGFRERPSGMTSRFFQRGREGGWREALKPAQVARILADHGPVMARFGYVDEQGRPR